jgi:rod shape-determining protein MreB
MMARKLAIDLGTVNTRMFSIGKGVVLDEPTVLAVSEDDKKVMAVGRTASDMIGKTPESILAISPLKNGVVADYELTEVLLRFFMDSVIGRSRLFKPDVLLSVPSGATSVESRAVLDAAYSAGAKRAFTTSASLAAAIGAGLPISEPSGNMIVNIGGGITESAVVSLNGVVTHGSTRVGGSDLDFQIAQHIRRAYGLVIGNSTAEKVKKDVGSAIAGTKSDQFEVKGRDAVSGFPKIITISNLEIINSFRSVLEQMALSIKDVLEKTPPELSSDIVDKGIVLSGGTAFLKNIHTYLSDYVGVPVHVADDPISCVIKGLGVILSDFQPFSKSLTQE